MHSSTATVWNPIPRPAAVVFSWQGPFTSGDANYQDLQLEYERMKSGLHQELRALEKLERLGKVTYSDGYWSNK